MSPSAYLLFYRRRSAKPLGGPRFQQIFDRYEAILDGAEEEALDAGEGQRLGQGSSRRGSPSASTGAGLALPQGSRGLARNQSPDTIGRSPIIDDEEQLPSYDDAIGHGALSVDDDVEMTPWDRQEPTLRNSIEADEGIDLPDYNVGTGAALQSNWTFNGLGARTAVDDDEIASDVAQNDDSSMNGDVFGADSPDGRIMTSVASMGDDETLAGFADDDEIPAPPPTEQAVMTQLAVKAWQQREQAHNIHTVVPADLVAAAEMDEVDAASDKVAEIHVGGDDDTRSATLADASSDTAEVGDNAAPAAAAKVEGKGKGKEDEKEPEPKGGAGSV